MDATVVQALPRADGGDLAPDAGGDATLAVTAVICAYTERRWPLTRAAVASVQAQSPGAAQILLVVDHNRALADRARAECGGVTVLESDGPPGLSGARNAGLRAATQPVTAFLDDDARARPGWLSGLIEPYSRSEVVATGGSVHPVWPAARPRWFPPAFDWVVGCSYRGLPETDAVIRNPIGANMSVRTKDALEAGGFDSGIGRTGTRPRGCEETELAIRLTSRHPGAAVLYVPGAAVDHHVSEERSGLRYFVRRCWHEGLSKAEVVRLAGARTGLARERRQAASVIPAAIRDDARAGLGGDPAALSRITASVTGLAAASAGYLTGRAAALARTRARGR